MHAPLVVGIVLAFGLGRLSIEVGVAPEHLGWLAAGLTLSTFLMRSMPARRLTGIAANPCFIGDAAPMALTPVLVLHMLLLPLSLLRLRDLGRERRRAAGASSAAAARR